VQTYSRKGVVFSDETTTMQLKNLEQLPPNPIFAAHSDKE
jgi:hypothetical protein